MRRHLAIALTAFLFMGCASTLNKGRSTITFSSDPAGATVVVNGQERGTTPYAYTYNPADGEEVGFEFRKDGHRSSSVTMHPSKAPDVLFVDAMLFHIPYIADSKSPDLYRIPVSEHTVVLRREITGDRTRYLMPITRVEVGIGERDDLGKLGNKPLRSIEDGPARQLQHPEWLQSAVVSGLKGSWMDAHQLRLGNEKGDEAVHRAKMHLQARITGMRAQLTGDKRHCYGPVELEVEWRIHSSTRTDSVLYQVTTTTTYHALQERATDVVVNALDLSAARFAEQTGLYERVAEIFGAGLVADRGGSVALKRPAAIPYNGRKEMLSALVKAVVTVSTSDGHGSGFLITNDGYLITNRHVVEDEALVKVRFEQGFSLDAQVVKSNTDFDLALLKVQATDLPALTLGDDAALMLGEELFAIGTPFDTALGQTVTRGILSGRRELNNRTFLQTDVSINPGNSGGPLVDENGHVVGINTMKVDAPGVEGLGFAVPIKQALEMLNIAFE